MPAKALCDEKKQELIRIIEDKSAAPLLHGRAADLLSSLDAISNEPGTNELVATYLLDALQESQRINFLYHAKADDKTIRAVEAAEKKDGRWKDYETLPVDPSLCQKLASSLIYPAFQHIAGSEFPDSFDDRPPLNKDKTGVMLSPNARGTAEHIISYMLKHDLPFEVDFSDNMTNKALVEHSTVSQVTKLAEYNKQKFAGISKRIGLVSRPPKEVAEDTGLDKDGKKQKIFESSLLPFRKRSTSDGGFYTLTKIPTPADAAIDQIDYKDYLKLFFELCDQPWKHIQKANAHLISKLNAAKEMSIVDEESGTNLTMRIDGKKWVNSLALKNIPGSEVFASPIKDSVNGTLVAKGRFQYKNSGIMEDITLHFKDGRITDFDARKGRDELAKIIEADDGKGEGSRFIGELAIGTNPWLKQHVINPLLVEKISGSFHMAVGNAYTYSKYDGEEVNIDNGNKSDAGIHWDITSMLSPKSRLVIDKGTNREYTILNAGKFEDIPELRVLNEGWAAIPETQRPDYWKNRLADEGPRNGWAASV